MTYCIARCQAEDKSKVIYIIDIPVLHELKIFCVNLQMDYEIKIVNTRKE